MERENPDRTRVGGVEFGPLKEALREHQYPVTAAELIEVYGGFELEGPDGSATVEEALGRVDVGKFRTPRDVRDAILEGIGEHVSNDTADGNAAEGIGETADDGIDGKEAGGDIDGKETDEASDDDGWSRKSV